MTINSFPVYEEELPMGPWSAKESRSKTMKKCPPWKLIIFILIIFIFLNYCVFLFFFRPNSPGTFA